MNTLITYGILVFGIGLAILLFYRRTKITFIEKSTAKILNFKEQGGWSGKRFQAEVYNEKYDIRETFTVSEDYILNNSVGDEIVVNVYKTSGKKYFISFDFSKKST